MDSWEASWTQSDYLWVTQPPPPPTNSQTFIFFAFGPIYENTGGYLYPLLYICLLCNEVLLPWKFGNPGFDVRAPRTPKYEYNNILDLNLKRSYQIASLFHMYIDMGERIAGKQDRPSLIIECPPPPP